MSSKKQGILDFIKRFRTWAMVSRQNMTSQEIETAESELQRVEHHVTFHLYQRRLKRLAIKTDQNLKLQMIQTERILTGREKYDTRQRGIVEECLLGLEKISPLGISATERVMILKAMDLPTGHWFKCPQGHVYAIGECGGAMEEAKCPECDARIGGTRHNLLQDNQLAPEMDNARYAAWSEQANMANYGFDAQF